MELETVDAIDVEGFEEGLDDCIDSESIRESIHYRVESIHEKTWFPAAEAKHRSGLDQSAFVRMIADLKDLHKIPVQALRRGQARSTEYSRTCINLLRALDSEDTETFEYIKRGLVPIQVSSSLVISSGHTLSLDRKIGELQQNHSSTSAVLAARFQTTLAKIADRNQASTERNSSLSNAEILAAKNRGALRALEIFDTEQSTCDELLAHLRTAELEG
jgi:hypothetical protein